jgi:hypothetical protein
MSLSGRFFFFVAFLFSKFVVVGPRFRVPVACQFGARYVCTDVPQAFANPRASLAGQLTDPHLLRLRNVCSLQLTSTQASSYPILLPWWLLLRIEVSTLVYTARIYNCKTAYSVEATSCHPVTSVTEWDCCSREVFRVTKSEWRQLHLATLYVNQPVCARSVNSFLSCTPNRLSQKSRRAEP